MSFVRNFKIQSLLNRAITLLLLALSSELFLLSTWPLKVFLARFHYVCIWTVLALAAPAHLLEASAQVPSVSLVVVQAITLESAVSCLDPHAFPVMPLSLLVIVRAFNLRLMDPKLATKMFASPLSLTTPKSVLALRLQQCSSFPRATPGKSRHLTSMSSPRSRRRR